MGSDKARLDWAGRPLVVRIVETLAAAVDGPIVVAAAPGQRLPGLPPALRARASRVEDPWPHGGPLVGFVTGLRALAEHDTSPAAVAVLAVDLPRIQAAHVRRVLTLLEAEPDADAVVPELDGRLQPLAAAWRPRVLPVAQALVADGGASMRALLAAIAVRTVTARDLLADAVIARTDPDLAGLRDVDEPGDLPPTPR